MRKILLIATGGTIASGPSENGLTPALSASQLMEYVPEVKNICEFDCKDILSLDSCNVSPEEWIMIGKETAEALKEYDGIVITHGTDTMAYTAAALSFMLRNPQKPVILTGSQIPISEPDTDGIKNLYYAFKAAATDIKGVFVFFGNNLLRGVRTSKVHTVDFNAFYSINEDTMGYVCNGELIISGAALGDDYDTGKFYIDPIFSDQVAVVKPVPGTDGRLILSAVAAGYKGIIVEGFGQGGLPNINKKFLDSIEAAVKMNVAVVVTTQCLLGGSDLSIYEVGKTLQNTGIIPSYDMTKEAITAKLMWVLGHTSDMEEIRKMMLHNYSGEFSLSPEEQ